MAAVGGARATDEEWVRRYHGIVAALGSGAPGAVAFGTDANGLLVLIDKPNGHRFDYSSFPKSALGAMSWDYNDVGVAHYGMLADFMHGLPTLTGGSDVVAGLMSGAEYFAATWEIAEAYARDHAVEASAVLHAAAAAVSCAPGTRWVHSCQRCLRPREPCTTLAAPHCGATRSLDPWGLCVTAKAKKAAPAAAAAPATGAGAPSLAAGEYTLLLVSADSSSDARKLFDVDVVPRGGRLELHSHGAQPGTNGPTLRGGFRGSHFLMRLNGNGSDRVLVLTAVGLSKGPLTEIMGAYAVHAPTHNQAEARTGTFLLTKTATTGAVPLTDLGPYLAQPPGQ
jgi:hypothetical protein